MIGKFLWPALTVFLLVLVAFTEKPSLRGRYMYSSTGFGPHSFFSTLDIKKDKFFIKSWTTGFFRKTDETQTGSFTMNGTHILFTVEQISYYEVVEDGDRSVNTKITCDCRTTRDTLELCDTFTGVLQGDTIVMDSSYNEYIRKR